MITAEYAVAKPVTYTTTLNLKAGDVIQQGNMFIGFSTYTIAGVSNDSYNNRMARVTIRFNHGGEVTATYGKNTKWSVIKAGN